MPDDRRTVFVDPERCIGCGICEQVCPQAFRLGAGGLAHVVAGPEDLPDCVREAAGACPQGAISVREGEAAGL